jgi:hypothetical protein
MTVLYKVPKKHPLLLRQKCLLKQCLRPFDGFGSIARHEFLQQRTIDSTLRSTKCVTRVIQVCWGTGEELHRNEILEAYHAQRLTMKRYRNRPLEGIEIHSTNSCQQIDSIPE